MYLGFVWTAAQAMVPTRHRNLIMLKDHRVGRLREAKAAVIVHCEAPLFAWGHFDRNIDRLDRLG